MAAGAGGRQPSSRGRNQTMFSFRHSQAAWTLAFLTIALATGRSEAGVTGQTDRLPQGYGLAAKYPGDQGIEKDPDVVFVENFEEPSLDAIQQRWEDVSHAEI